jgi:hypothetical protein
MKNGLEVEARGVESRKTKTNGGFAASRTLGLHGLGLIIENSKSLWRVASIDEDDVESAS